MGELSGESIAHQGRFCYNVLHMKLALIHDDFLQWGGAERVVAAIAQIWPTAPIYTSVSDPAIIQTRIKNPINQSYLRYLPAVSRMRRVYLPFYPAAFQNMPLNGYDIILSSSTRFAHTITKPDTAIHITYMHAPPRFVWQFDKYVQHEQHAFAKRIVTGPIVSVLRQHDLQASQNVSYWVANSQNVAKKIRQIYRHQADVIYPFVDTKLFTPAKQPKAAGYYLVVSRLVAWKRVDIAIEACKKLGKTLVIIGKGPDKPRLQKIAQQSDTTFIEELTDKALVTYYRNCDALLMTQNEDFGMTALEAAACGRPVIAFGKGGVLEIVIAGKTGEFFPAQDARSLTIMLRKFDRDKYDPNDCSMLASQFSKEKFQQAIKRYVEEKYHVSK